MTLIANLITAYYPGVWKAIGRTTTRHGTASKSRRSYHSIVIAPRRRERGGNQPYKVMSGDRISWPLKLTPIGERMRRLRGLGRP